jgi:hypothetical protein
VVPTSVILEFLCSTIPLRAIVNPFLTSGIWKVKEPVSYCMQEIGMTLLSLFLFNAVFFADFIND